MKRQASYTCNESLNMEDIHLIEDGNKKEMEA